jgi:hypothetical protein
MKKWILLSVGGFVFRWIQKQMRNRPVGLRQRNG